MGNKQVEYFTTEELRKFDGKAGRPLYVIFKGKVYDLSSSRLWTGGVHLGVHTRNENLTETIKGAPHGDETLARFPIVGELREAIAQPIAPSKPAAPVAIEKSQPLERRDFLKLVAAAGGAITLAALATSLKPLTFVPEQAAQLSWPQINVTNISSVELLNPISFNYPLTDTPNFLVKLGVTADNGIGPDGDIVAFSNICQHLGCYPGFVAPNSSPPCNSSFKASISEAYCCCHGSQYDLAHGAKVISGPAPHPLPQVQLQLNQSTGDISAVAMGPPTIFGHGPSGTTDPALVLKYDLQGGTVVGT